MKSTVARFPKGLELQLTENFKLSEFHCKCNLKSCNETLVDLEHVTELQKLRDEVGSLLITSAYRCEAHNKAVGGSKNSRHRLGLATDIISFRINPKTLAGKCKHFIGLGVYSTFLHIDSREGNKVRWDFTNKENK